MISSASLGAIRSLQAINAQIDQTQDRISSGLKIASAKDGPSNWSTAQTLRSDIKSYEEISSNIDYMKSAFDVAESGAQLVYDTVSGMRTLLVVSAGATWTSAETAAANNQLLSMQAQLKSIISDSAFKSGSATLNMLNSATDRKVLVNFTTDGSSAAAANVIKVTPSNIYNLLDATTAALGTGTKDFFDFTLSGANTAGTAAALTAFDTLLGSIATDIAAFGGASNQLDSAKSVIKTLSDVKSAALSSLVDADMEEESARLSALQVKQQLAIQSLSIANSAGQNVLRLFQ